MISFFFRMSGASFIHSKHWQIYLILKKVVCGSQWVLWLLKVLTIKKFGNVNVNKTLAYSTQLMLSKNMDKMDGFYTKEVSFSELRMLGIPKTLSQQVLCSMGVSLWFTVNSDHILTWKKRCGSVGYLFYHWEPYSHDFLSLPCQELNSKYHKLGN